MMNRFKHIIPHVSILFGVMLVSACTTDANDLVIQSKFSYPNGNYNAVGHASAERKYTTFLSAPEFTREVFYNLQQDALSKQPNANLLVNYVVSSSVTQLFPVFLTTFRVDGTAVNLVEAGGQQYRSGPTPSPDRTN